MNSYLCWACKMYGPCYLKINDDEAIAAICPCVADCKAEWEKVF